MTFGILNVLGVLALNQGKDPPKHLLFSYDSWPFWQKKLYDYCIACHCGHLLDFLAALTCYLLVFPSTMPEAAKGFSIGWISKVVVYNLCTMLIIVGGWHWFTCKYITVFLTISLMGDPSALGCGEPTRALQGRWGWPNCAVRVP